MRLPAFLRASFAVALGATTLLACAADPSDATETEDADVAEEDLKGSKDVTADLVGRYAPPQNAPGGAVSKLLLKTDKSYELTSASGVERGTFKATESSGNVTLRLAPASGSAKNYRAKVGTGFRPILTLSRYSTTWILEREPTSCQSVNCNPGYGCAVEAYEGVPRPVCNPVVPAWQLAFQGEAVWGATFRDVDFGQWTPDRRTLSCSIRPKEATINCSTNGFDPIYTAVSATIQPDGTFAYAAGGPNQSGGELRGRIAQDGTVTVERFRKTECFQTSSFWCEGRETNGASMPKSVKAVPICRTPDITFQSGGWAMGYWLACSECQGRCEGGR